MRRYATQRLKLYTPHSEYSSLFVFFVYSLLFLLRVLCIQFLILIMCSLYTVICSCYMFFVYSSFFLLHVLCIQFVVLVSCSLYTVLCSCYVFFVCSSSDVVNPHTDALNITFVEYIDGARMFLELEADKDNPMLNDIRLHFSKFIYHLIRNTPGKILIMFLKLKH